MSYMNVIERTYNSGNVKSTSSLAMHNIIIQTIKHQYQRRTMGVSPSPWQNFVKGQTIFGHAPCSILPPKI